MLDSGAYLASQFDRWLFIEVDRNSMPESHTGRERHIEIFLVQVFWLYGYGLLVNRQQCHIVLVFSGFKAFYYIVVLRAEHVCQYKGIIAVEW